MSDNPTRQRRPAPERDLKMPDFRDYASKVASPGATIAESAREWAKIPRDINDRTWIAKKLSACSVDEKTRTRCKNVLDVTGAAIWPTLSGR